MFTNIKFTDHTPEVGEFSENTWIWNEKRKQMFLSLPKKVIAFGVSGENLFDFTKTKTELTEKHVHYLGEVPQTLLEPRSPKSCIIPLQAIIVLHSEEGFKVKDNCMVQINHPNGIVLASTSMIDTWADPDLVDAPRWEKDKDGRITSVLMINRFPDNELIPGLGLEIKLTDNPVAGQARMCVHLVYQDIELC